MPLGRVHFNGSVNLADGETVMRELAARVPQGATRIPDGETGDRGQWIGFQFQRFVETPGLELPQAQESAVADYGPEARVQLAAGVDPADVRWPDLGYAGAYLQSYETFRRLMDEGVIPGETRFQVQYPTPLASIVAFVARDQQDAVEPSYAGALMADLERLLAEVPHEELAVQWDVCSEIALLAGMLEATATQNFDGITQRLARCADQVPDDVPVGFHLCYGDYGHKHFVEPESLELQVTVANGVSARAKRSVSWFSFTVPQDRGDDAYFAPLSNLDVSAETELYFGIVPYHPDRQKPGTTADQVRHLEALLNSNDAEEQITWGISTECGLARAESEEVPPLLDAHREILETHGALAGTP